MKFFKKSDLIIVSAIIIAGILLMIANNYLNKDKYGRAEIYYKSGLVKTVDLHTGEDRRFSIPQNKHVVFHLYKDGSICFEESDCPDRICIKTGELKRVGETAACLPNKIIMKIVPAANRNSDDPEIIVGK